MSVLTLNVDEVMRTLSASGGAFVVHDKEVDIVRFAINSGFADIVLDGQVALRVMYQRPGETEAKAQTLTYYDTDGLRNYYDWQLSQSDLAKNGSLMVALCILDISGGEVSEWHTTPCAVRVLSTIHTDDSDEGDDTITPTVKERVAVLETMIQRVASGSPIVVSSTSAMTDTSQIYVLSTDGHWYYHNGSAWVSGGEYGAAATDTTLTQSGIPADAKAVGDDISLLGDDISLLNESLGAFISAGNSKTVNGSYVSILDGASDTVMPTIIYDIPFSSTVKNQTRIYVHNKNWIRNEAQNLTINGVTFTVNEDKSITVNGTASALVEYNITADASRAYFNKFPKNTPFILSGSPENNDPSKYKFRIFARTVDYIDTGDGIEVPNIVPAGTHKISIVVYQGTTMNNVTFYPMLSLKAQFDGVYETPASGLYDVALSAINPQMYGGTVNFITGECVSKYDSSGNLLANPVTYAGNVEPQAQSPMPIKLLEDITNIIGTTNNEHYGQITVQYSIPFKETLKTSQQYVYVAASNSTDSAKSVASYVCNGTNDELVIQSAINYANINSIGEVRLAEGDYYIDSFPRNDPSGVNIALAFGTDGTTNKACSVKLTGGGYGGLRKYGTYSEVFKGAVIHVTQSCYDSLSSTEQCAIIGVYTPGGRRTYPSVKLAVENISFKIPANQKKIICVDGWYCTALSFDNLHCMAITVQGGSGSGNIPPSNLVVAVEGCIGIRGLQGDCYGVNNIWRNAFVWGFYEGFSVTGEHIIAENLGARFCNYGYTFGVCDGRSWTGSLTHPNTLINCCDELNFNLPLFGATGIYSNGVNGKQYVNLIDYNMEWRSEYYSVLGGDLAKEIEGYTAYGAIVYTNRTQVGHSVETRFWETGYGKNVKTMNGMHASGGTSELRRTYIPNYMQTYYDTTLNKLLVYDGSNWRDATGATI